MTDRQPTVRALLEKNGRQTHSVKEGGEPDVDADYSAYAHGRISRHTQAMLIFRRADGSAKAFAYACLLSVAGDDTTAEFRIEFSQHKVAEIREAERHQGLAAAPESAVVESIQIDDAAGANNRRNES